MRRRAAMGKKKKGDVSAKELITDMAIAGMLTVVCPPAGLGYAAARARDYVKRYREKEEE